jgi:hypothetical protein
MTGVVQINPNGVYDDGALYCELGLSAATLARARRGGKLRYTQQGRRTLYFGEWILSWLRADGQQGRVAVATAS